MAAAAASEKPHVLVFPYPAQGHINPMMQLAQELASQGIRITFVCTQYRCDGILEEHGADNADNDGHILLPARGGMIQVEGLPDGLPPDFDRSSPSTELTTAVDNLGGAFDELLHRLQEVQKQRIACLICDSFLPWTHDIAVKRRIPRAFFWTQSAVVLAIFANTDRLLSNGLDPFTANLDTATQVVDYIPGVPALPASHLPYRTFKTSMESEDRRFLLRANLEKKFKHLQEAAWILANSYEELEGPCLRHALGHRLEILDNITGPGPGVLWVGPLLRWEQSVARHEACLRWLDTKPAGSVLYVALGSVVRLTWEEAGDVARALLTSGQLFLWALRTKGEGQSSSSTWREPIGGPEKMVVEWAPQARVLAHPAVGGFLTHGGWNSTLEGSSAGVPMLVWPRFMDQFTNAWLVSRVWKIGLELCHVGDLEASVRCLMNDGDLRRRAAAFRRPPSSSSNNPSLRSFIRDLHHRHSLLGHHPS